MPFNKVFSRPPFGKTYKFFFSSNILEQQGVVGPEIIIEFFSRHWRDSSNLSLAYFFFSLFSSSSSPSFLPDSKERTSERWVGFFTLLTLFGFSSKKNISSGWKCWIEIFFFLRNKKKKKNDKRKKPGDDEKNVTCGPFLIQKARMNNQFYYFSKTI